MDVPRQRRCIPKKDPNGTYYTVPQDTNSPALTVWWNRGPRKRVTLPAGKKVSTHTEQEEEIMIRQVNDPMRADLVILTPGQVYDLIDALCQSVEKP